jgi:hypothetical protein
MSNIILPRTNTYINSNNEKNFFDLMFNHSFIFEGKPFRTIPLIKHDIKMKYFNTIGFDLKCDHDRTGGLVISFKNIKFIGIDEETVINLHLTFHKTVKGQYLRHKVHSSFVYGFLDNNYSGRGEYVNNLIEDDNFLFNFRNDEIGVIKYPNGELIELTEYNNLLMNSKNPNIIMTLELLQYSLACISYYLTQGMNGIVSPNFFYNMQSGSGIKNNLYSIKKEYLLSYCKKNKLKGYSKYNKEDLIKFIKNNIKI